MNEVKHEEASKAVSAIVADLNDRSGLGLDGIDEETCAEIVAKWERIVTDAIETAIERSIP